MELCKPQKIGAPFSVNQARYLAIISADSGITVHLGKGWGPGTVIRFVAIGVTGLVALGAVAALGRSAIPASPQAAVETTVYPESSGAKGDRLLTTKKQEAALAIPAATTIEPKETINAVVSTPNPQAKTRPKEPAFIPRHWHDSATSAYTIRKRNAAEATAAQSRAVENPRQNCSRDGLSPLLRKLNLQRDCEL